MSNALKIASALGAASGAPTDPNFSSVSLLLHGDGTNGAQNNTFIDGSSNNFTITRNGNTTQGNLTPFGTGGSGYFDGTGDYLTAPDNAAFDFGNGNFTVEMWVYFSASVSGTAYIFTGQGISAFNSDCSWLFLRHSSNVLRFITTDTGNSNFTIVDSSSSWLPNTGQWYHIAAVRNSGTITLYVNGTSVGSGSNSTTFFNSTRVLGIGASSAGESPINGYISNVRILNGTALYTGNFTPPTSPLTAITNTQLLLNFTNAGITDSARKADLETVGNAQVSTSVVKFGTGSIAFDGTGDWLTSPDSTNLQLGTGAFTIECWLYLSATGAARGIVGKGTATTGWLLSVNASNQVVFTDTTTAITSTGTLSGTTWYHIAVVREGTGSNQTKIYIGGSNDGTGTSATNFNQTNIMYVGANRTGGDALNGYIDDLRITKGVARYTANFTPPTAAFPDS